MVAIVRQGIKSDIYGWLRQALAVSDHRLSAIIRVSQRTIKRRLRDGKFQPDESERLLRVAKLTERAQDVFGDLESAREWLKAPQFALGGEIPLEYADTEPGAQVAEDVLGRLEHGIPIETVGHDELPEDGRQTPEPNSTRDIGTKWAAERRSPVLAVPSVVVPNEHNYLLNPAHPDFSKIKIGKPKAIDWDPRLIKLLARR
jgi:putative toxin-antitoxin system antitoxin component (TIGR02293 family)